MGVVLVCFDVLGEEGQNLVSEALTITSCAITTYLPQSSFRTGSWRFWFTLIRIELLPTTGSDSWQAILPQKLSWALSRDFPSNSFKFTFSKVSARLMGENPLSIQSGSSQMRQAVYSGQQSILIATENFIRSNYSVVPQSIPIIRCASSHLSISSSLSPTFRLVHSIHH